MTAPPNHGNGRIKHDGQETGQPHGLDGDTNYASYRHELCDVHGRDGLIPSSNEAVKSPTRKNPQRLPSPSPSGDDAEDEPSEWHRGWESGALSVAQRKRANGVQQREELLRANNTEATWSAWSSSTLMVTQPEDESIGSGDDDLSDGGVSENDGKGRVRKLSSAKMYELTASPQSLPLYPGNSYDAVTQIEKTSAGPSDDLKIRSARGDHRNEDTLGALNGGCSVEGTTQAYSSTVDDNEDEPYPTSRAQEAREALTPQLTSRTYSTPGLKKRRSTKSNGSNRSPGLQASRHFRSTPTPLPLNKTMSASRSPGLGGNMPSPMPSPMPSSIPAPPLSLPTHLQLELSSNRPSPLYIHRSVTSDFPYESSRVKIERLQNFLLLPPQLEQVLWFGALACLDAWLYSFTILPLRFVKALSILVQSWSANTGKEIRFIVGFMYAGAGRMWHRRRRKSSAASASAVDVTQTEDDLPQSGAQKNDGVLFPPGKAEDSTPDPRPQPNRRRRGSTTYRRHRRTKSTPSALRPNHKADLLKGLLILISCTILMYFDASRMYHGIRGQAAIKLYVIYNVLEVCDRLFSAIGQDVLECLFSKEALERKPDGRSKVLRPFWLFILALLYNLVHATALFYQVITLNVAVNSYSNALLTLLMSNQFVEIKSTVFKKFEKENLFQLTCADVVERFQLWLMLTIIAARNIIETGGLSLSSSDSTAPVRSSSILPQSFTLFPPWTGQIMGPFLLVLGSEMLVDWIKHAYITKFNLTKPAIYGRFLDVLAKDYYSNAFADQNLTRRLGLPVIPLSCLFIRASVQTYHMFLATHVPLPIPSTATSLSVEEAASSPATTAALQHIDHIFRRALGRSTFGGGSSPPTTSSYFNISAYLTTDDLIAFTTMVLFFLILFLLLLALKLVLGMCLLSFARRRYKGMKERERENEIHAEGKRVSGWGVVEVDEDKRRWIYMDDPEGARRLREREKLAAEKGRESGKEGEFGSVERYQMVAKRIW